MSSRRHASSVNICTELSAFTAIDPLLTIIHNKIAVYLLHMIHTKLSNRALTNCMSSYTYFCG